MPVTFKTKYRNYTIYQVNLRYTIAYTGKLFATLPLAFKYIDNRIANKKEKPNPLSPTSKASLKPKQRNKCCYCGFVFYYYINSINRQRTIDHIIPLSKGGNNRAANKRFACSKCNHEKADHMPLDYLEILIQKSPSIKNKREHKKKIKNLKTIIEYTNLYSGELFKTEELFMDFAKNYINQARFSLINDTI